ncbi:TPA: HNH endonuclease [Neisseria meningitidis]|nr:HNH endonuclease [Neisseria meningitidis]
MRLSDGIFDTKQVTKRAFDGKGTSKIPDYTWHHHQDTGCIAWKAMNKRR